MKVEKIMNEKMNSAKNHMVSLYHFIIVWGFYIWNAGTFSYKNSPGQGKLQYS